VAFWSGRKPDCRSLFFCAEYDSGWIKEHGRLQRWRLQRVEVSPEEAGLCGCWQFIAVLREREYLRAGKVIKSEKEYSFYTTSLAHRQYSAAQLAECIRGHWDASENGSHYRRDVTLGEDASLIGGRKAAQAMSVLRNLVVGLFEMQKHKDKTQVAYLPSWQRKMTATEALSLIKGG
jgi:predicted transposase YbfD/YdcC